MKFLFISLFCIFSMNAMFTRKPSGMPLRTRTSCHTHITAHVNNSILRAYAHMPQKDFNILKADLKNPVQAELIEQKLMQTVKDHEDLEKLLQENTQLITELKSSIATLNHNAQEIAEHMQDINNLSLGGVQGLILSGTSLALGAALENSTLCDVGLLGVGFSASLTMTCLAATTVSNEQKEVSIKQEATQNKLYLCGKNQKVLQAFLDELKNKKQRSVLP